MFGLSFTHLVLLAILALILIGPKQLPEVARTLGRLFNEFKRATNVLGDEVREAIHKNNAPPPAPKKAEAPVIEKIAELPSADSSGSKDPKHSG